MDDVHMILHFVKFILFISNPFHCYVSSTLNQIYSIAVSLKQSPLTLSFKSLYGIVINTDNYSINFQNVCTFIIIIFSINHFEGLPPRTFTHSPTPRSNSISNISTCPTCHSIGFNPNDDCNHHNELWSNFWSHCQHLHHVQHIYHLNNNKMYHLTSYTITKWL